MTNFTVLFVSDYSAEVHIFNAAEDVLLDLRIDFFEFGNEVLDLKTL